MFMDEIDNLTSELLASFNLSNWFNWELHKFLEMREVFSHFTSCDMFNWQVDCNIGCFRLYAELLENAIFSDESDVELSASLPCDSSSATVTQPSEQAAVVRNLLGEVAKKIDKTKVCRVNVNRANVWEGAVRAFNRKTYDPLQQMLIRFADDSGITEGAIDQGGPLREFLRLMYAHIFTSQLFTGTETNRSITLDLRGQIFKMKTL